jgi:hypothetical protein
LLPTQQGLEGDGFFSDVPSVMKIIIRNAKSPLRKTCFERVINMTTERKKTDDEMIDKKKSKTGNSWVLDQTRSGLEPRSELARARSRLTLIIAARNRFLRNFYLFWLLTTMINPNSQLNPFKYALFYEKTEICKRRSDSKFSEILTEKNKGRQGCQLGYGWGRSDKEFVKHCALRMLEI